MLVVDRTAQFKRDLKRMLKRGKDEQKIRAVIIKLAHQEPLPQKYCDHPLSGNYNKARECHIEPDWLLIYTPMQEAIRLERTGSHSDLF